MNRYRFTRESLANTIEFLKGKRETGPTWAVRYKEKLEVKGDKVFFEGKEIVPQKDIDTVLRREMYKRDGEVGTGRDSAFHLLKQKYIGIPRRPVMEFIRKQRVLQTVKPALPQPRQMSGKKLKMYTFETDLVFLKKKDLENANKIFIRKDIPELSYFLTVVEKVTGLSRFSYVRSKEAKVVSPLVLKHCNEMCAVLHTTIGQTEIENDAGGEFETALFKTHFKNAKTVSMAPSCENKNRMFQQHFFRILRQRKAKTILDAMDNSEKLLNNCFNRIHKQTPNELIERNDEKLDLKEYNKKRAVYISGDKRKPFEVGQLVYLQIKKKKAGLEYKSYKGNTFSKQLYKIEKITKKSVPRKYYVNKHWRTQDVLLKGASIDKVSDALIEERDKVIKKKADKKETKYIEKEWKKLQKAQKEKTGRPKRRSAIAARADMLESLEENKKIDDSLDAIEEEEEKREVVEEKKELAAEEKKEVKKQLEDDETEELRAWLKKRKLPFTGPKEILKKRIALKRKLEKIAKKRRKLLQKLKLKQAK